MDILDDRFGDPGGGSHHRFGGDIRQAFLPGEGLSSPTCLNQSWISLAKVALKMPRAPPSYCGDLKSAELFVLRGYNQELMGIDHRHPTFFWDVKRGDSTKFPESGDKF